MARQGRTNKGYRFKKAEHILSEVVDSCCCVREQIVRRQGSAPHGLFVNQRRMYIAPYDATTAGPTDGLENLNTPMTVVPTVEEAAQCSSGNPIVEQQQRGRVRKKGLQYHSRGVEEVRGKWHAISPALQGCRNACCPRPSPILAMVPPHYLCTPEECIARRLDYHCWHSRQRFRVLECYGPNGQTTWWRQRTRFEIHSENL